MKIFEAWNARGMEVIDPCSGSLWLQVEDQRRIEAGSFYNSGPWVPPEFKIERNPLPDDEVEFYLPSKVSAMLGRYLILRDQAISSISHLLEPYGELLPLACGEAELMLWWPRMVVDCLIDDVNEAGELLWSIDNERVLMIQEPEFDPQRVPDCGAFVLPQPKYPSLVWFTEELVEKLLATGNTAGIRFREAWDSEKNSFKKSIK
ncbi:hypothetical protein KEM60_03144 [Austwickia sp. TVS 96-490-7B]|uniref:hypothetical protein n=1 Tax=Austwickia sp. TVS 96-490-7B TaxID=2830843 RepID=UPI001C580587|nr:hypothetical protein [Austwickia sp. TVS 96-490-7B]MBW3086915.1 hypothetical protein [Austwickia sp. TVS 96-490-7B]